MKNITVYCFLLCFAGYQNVCLAQNGEDSSDSDSAIKARTEKFFNDIKIARQGASYIEIFCWFNNHLTEKGMLIVLDSANYEKMKLITFYTNYILLTDEMYKSFISESKKINDMNNSLLTKSGDGVNIIVYENGQKTLSLNFNNEKQIIGFINMVSKYPNSIDEIPNEMIRKYKK